MRTHLLRLSVAALLPALILARPAHADDDDDRESPYVTEGEIRAGWRFLAGEGEGRFPQDEALQDGPRIFDFSFRVRDDRPESGIDEIEARASGVGDANQDYLLSVRDRDRFRLEAGLRRDDYSYRATGDPFPFDTVRERTFVRGRWWPSKGLGFRFEFDRQTRRGDAFTSRDTDRRELPAPAGVDEDLTRDRRPLDQQFDTYVLGVDGGRGVFRWGVTQTLRTTSVDDLRVYDIPPSRRGTAPVRESLRRQARAKAWSTVAKGGLTTPDDRLALNLFVTHTDQPADTRTSGTARGFDDVFSGVGPRGNYAATIDGDSRIHRSIAAWRAESLLRPHRDLEIVASVEQEEQVDDASLDLVERRTYARPDVTPKILRTRSGARITDRTDRIAVEMAWDVTDDLRVRLGREHLDQDVDVPVDSRGRSLHATEYRTAADRTMAGVDVEPLEDLTLSALLRRTDEDDPHANASAETADELVVRARYRTGGNLTLATVYRFKDFHQGDRFDSDSRVESLSHTGTWVVSESDRTRALWEIFYNLSVQDFTTRTGTSFLEFDGATLTRVTDRVGYETRDFTGSLTVRRHVTSRLRLSAEVRVVESDRDYEALYREAALGGEFDLVEDVTLGAALRAWRFDERARDVDDYRAEALEVYVLYRF